MKIKLFLLGLLSQTAFSQNFQQPLELPVKNPSKIDYYCLKGQKSNFLNNDYSMLLKGNKDANVTAVFEGVLEKLQINGSTNQNIVFIRQGEYMALYEGIENLLFQIGDRVNKGDTLGKVPKNGIIFQLRKNVEKVDLKNWFNLNCEK